jgi:arginine-tRNA-protein transferase
MLSENYIYYPEQLTGQELDVFLEKGWYRMGQSIFTTHFISLQERIHRVFWLRYNLNSLVLGRTHHRLIKKNKQFKTLIKPMEITDELEELYALYKTGIDFEPAQSIHHWLYGDQVNNVFDTDLVEVRDNEKIIAAGIFDKGHNTIAGIMNFYHPDYKKFSLGKYLILAKMRYAKANNKQWYYPGYIVYNHPGFDYKLFADKSATELFIPEQEGWKLYTAELLDQYGNAMNAFFDNQ